MLLYLPKKNLNTCLMIINVISIYIIYIFKFISQSNMHIYFVIGVPTFVSLYLQATSIIKFNGLNFSYWCEQIRFHLRALDLDLALLSEKLVVLTNDTSVEDVFLHGLGKIK